MLSQTKRWTCFERFNEMKIHCHLLTTILLCLQTRNGLGGLLYTRPGDIHYIARIFNLTIVDSTGQQCMINQKWTIQNMTHYLSADLIARKTYMLHKVQMRLERCRDLEFSCEDFLTFNIPEICKYYQMKNQIWSSTIGAIKPKFFSPACPRIEQGNYVLENLYQDIDVVIRMYKEALKYYWKWYVFLFDKKGEVQHQSYGHLRFIPYTKRKLAISAPLLNEN